MPKAYLLIETMDITAEMLTNMTAKAERLHWISRDDYTRITKELDEREERDEKESA